MALTTADGPGGLVVVGAGAVGLAAAVALARGGFAVTLIGQTPRAMPGRTIALLQGSVSLLREIGVWPALADHAAQLRTMRIVDATGSLFRTPPVAFEAAEIGLDAFGYNVSNAALDAALRDVAAGTPGLTLMTDTVSGVAFDEHHASVKTDAGLSYETRLVVAADGRESRARKAAHIGVRTTAHPQRAITAVFTHEAPHRDVSTEFHTRQGPFTLVPLQSGADTGNRSSLVWVMSPAEAERRRALAPEALAREAEAQCRRLLGAMRVEGAIGQFPIVTNLAARLTGPRLVLIGEAAHALPPIGAQGLNLSFRDVAILSDHLTQTRSRGQDIGAADTLARYARSRGGDIAMRALGVGMLNQSLLTRSVAADFARGVGLLALGGAAPLRRVAMRRGLAPGSPRLVTRP